MKWYDFFSNFYDQSLEKLYASTRKKAAEVLDLQDGQIVLDVACGTGANFRHLLERNPNIKLIGTDFSQGMLAKAQKLAEANQWKSVHLFQADARTLTLASISKYAPDGFDKVVCVLGLSVIPDWEVVLSNLIGLLKPGGKIVVVDVFAEQRTFNTWLVEKIAKADLDRKIRQQLQSKTERFELEYADVKESKVGGKLFIASGIKK